MSIITLTTDLGHRDFYQGALKGSIISLVPDVQIVDITHEISMLNITHAAFVLRHAYPFFPIGSVHVVGVDTAFDVDRGYIAMRYKGHYFVGVDNGIFGIITDEESPEELVEINIIQDLRRLHFPLVDIMVKAACHIIKGGSLSEIGKPFNTLIIKKTFQPICTLDSIKGHVEYIDSFGNVTSNISKELFNQVQNGRPFTLTFKRNETIDRMSWHYNEVGEGDKLCLFGITNYLEIAINKASASSLLGLQQDDVIKIDFFNKK